MNVFRPLAALATCAALASLSGHASAERLFGVTDAGTAASTLVSFDSASAGSLTSIGSITGITAGQTLRGIDFRPSNGLLYGISNNGITDAAQVYTINTSTGVATALGGPLTLTGNTSARISLDFNPVVDVLRVVTGSGGNYRVNANTGALIAQDTSIASTSLISGIAYTNNRPGATQTTLYAYDFNDDVVKTIGSVNGTPNSPNSGILSNVGQSGFVSFSGALGFDISGATGIAYLAFDDNASPTDASELFTLNLATGAATFAGQFGVALLDVSVAPVPEPGTWALMLGGCGVLGAVARRRRAAR